MDSNSAVLTANDIDIEALLQQMNSESEEQKERNKRDYEEYCKRYEIYGPRIC